MMRLAMLSLLLALPITSSCRSTDEPGDGPGGERGSPGEPTAALDPAEPTEAAVPLPPVPIEAVVIGEVPNLNRFEDIYTAAQPRREDFEQLAEHGVRTVVNLRYDREYALDERALVEQLGMTYVELPWNGPQEMTDELQTQMRRMFEELERPVLVHCGSANRVGAVWISWRVLDGGIDVEQAVREAQAIGLRTPAYEQRARGYVDGQR